MDDIFPKELRIPIFERATVSSSGKYKLYLEQARIKFTNIIVTRGIIVDMATNQILIELDLQRDPKTFWHSWLRNGDGKEYLLGRGSKGGILLSLTNRKILDINTGFEWKAAKVSPNGDKLAIVCDRASNKPIRVYDFRDPEMIPYPELSISRFPDIQKMDPYASEIDWDDNNRIRVSAQVHSKDQLSFGFDYYCEEFTLIVKSVSPDSQDLTQATQATQPTQGTRNGPHRYNTDHDNNRKQRGH